MSGADEVRRDLTGLLPRLWRFAVYLTRNGELAEDLVQSTCLRALEKAHQYKADTRLDRWALTIMTSVWKNTLRSAAKFDARASGDIEAVAVGGVNLAETSVFAQQVLEGVSGLPRGQRAVVALVCVERWSYRETADALDIPIGTVMSRLANARKTLARFNADPDDEDASKGATT